MKSLNDPLGSLNIRPTTREVLKTLASLGRSPAADIAARLNRPKSSIYDGLDELMKLGLAVEESDDSGRIFALAEPEQIAQIKAKQVSGIEFAFAELAKLKKQNTKTVARPRIRFYAGVDGIRQAFRDTQWTSEYKDSYLMWPMKDMLDTLGEDFLKFHSEGRFKHQVMIHSIRKESDRSLEKPEHEWLKNDPEAKLREIRYASKDTEWSMSFWAYGDQTLFASSGSERFAFVVRSQEFTDMMILLWKQMWERSTK